MSHFDSCRLTLIWLVHITLNYWPRSFVLCWIGKCNILYQLICRAKRLVFQLSPRDGHVIIVSGCLILTAVNLIILIWMAYITERLVKLCKIYCDIWHQLTWSVCTDGQAGVRYVITKFSLMDSLPNFVTHYAPYNSTFLLFTVKYNDCVSFSFLFPCFFFVKNQIASSVLWN